MDVPGLADVTLFGVLVTVLSIPCALGWVPRNRFFGFRVPATLHSDAVWYRINRRSGVEIIAVGSALAVLSASMDAVGLDTPAGRTIAFGVMLAAVLLVTARGWRAANRLERELKERSR